MDKLQAQSIVKEIFENPFDKERFNIFIKNLLNSVDETKAFRARGDVKEMFKLLLKLTNDWVLMRIPMGKK